jgi:hypothetical protein
VSEPCPACELIDECGGNPPLGSDVVKHTCERGVALDAKRKAEARLGAKAMRAAIEAAVREQVGLAQALPAPRYATAEALKDLTSRAKRCLSQSPAPWRAKKQGIAVTVHDAEGYVVYADMLSSDRVIQETDTVDAQYIASAHPGLVLELLDALQKQTLLVQLFRQKRAVDGGNGRTWNAGLHLDAEEAIRALEGEPSLLAAAKKKDEERAAREESKK